MKNNYTFYLILLALPISVFLLTGYSAGQTVIQATGSPGDSNQTCAMCHLGSANYGAVASITTNIPASGYVAGSTYDITFTITSPQTRNGFQLTAEDIDGGKVGDFSTDLSDSQVANSNHLVTHTSSGNMQNTWTFQWVAPALNTGDVTFYAAGNATNNDNNDTGDQIVTTSLTVLPSNLSVASEDLIRFNVYPNPVINSLNIDMSEFKDAEIQIINSLGQVVSSFKHNTNTSVDVSFLAPGYYTLSLESGNIHAVSKFVKK